MLCGHLSHQLEQVPFFLLCMTMGLAMNGLLDISKILSEVIWFLHEWKNSSGKTSIFYYLTISRKLISTLSMCVILLITFRDGFSYSLVNITFNVGWLFFYVAHKFSDFPIQNCFLETK